MFEDNVFEDSLKFGKAGEDAIGQWLRGKGYCVLPIYEKIVYDGKGPQLYVHGDSLVAPDLFVFNGERAMWVEAKRKSHFSLYRKTNRWVTGISLRHYNDYLKVDSITPWPVVLLFLHDNSDSPDGICPTGLFGGYLAELARREDHRSEVSDMVYWESDSLYKIARLEDVYG